MSRNTALMNHVFPKIDMGGMGREPAPDTYYFHFAVRFRGGPPSLARMLGRNVVQQSLSGAICKRKFEVADNLCRRRTYYFFQKESPQALAETLLTDIVKAEPVIKVCKSDSVEPNRG
jgi:hypothetical protein